MLYITDAMYSMFYLFYSSLKVVVGMLVILRITICKFRIKRHDYDNIKSFKIEIAI